MKLFLFLIFLSSQCLAGPSPIIWDKACPAGAYNLADQECLAEGGSGPFLPLSGGTMSGNIDMDFQDIIDPGEITGDPSFTNGLDLGGQNITSVLSMSGVGGNISMSSETLSDVYGITGASGNPVLFSTGIFMAGEDIDMDEGSIDNINILDSNTGVIQVFPGLITTQYSFLSGASFQDDGSGDIVWNAGYFESPQYNSGSGIGAALDGYGNILLGSGFGDGYSWSITPSSYAAASLSIAPGNDFLGLLTLNPDTNAVSTLSGSYLEDGSGNIAMTGQITAGDDLRAGVHIRDVQSGNITVTSCGSSPSVTSGSNDARGKITVGSGATSCQVNFITAYTSAPFCTISPANTTAAGGAIYVSASATGSFTVSGTTVAGDVFIYHCLN